MKFTETRKNHTSAEKYYYHHKPQFLCLVNFLAWQEKWNISGEMEYLPGSVAAALWTCCAMIVHVYSQTHECECFSKDESISTK